MKKSRLFLVGSFLLTTTLMNAQVQRTCLAEGFSNASCGPCAAQNPNYNTLLSGNTSKVIAVKYQTNWPGVDPMNAQTQTNVAPRVTYYSVSGVPWGCLDGTAYAGSNYSGALANLDQSEIDTRYGVTSPFSLTVTHTLSSDLDSVFVTVTASTPSAFSGTNMKLHVLLTEEHITFSSAPGSNGETNFYHVMRDMYPNGSGTSIPNSWSAAQSQNWTFAKALPSYIYDHTQISVVAFIQDDGSKVVHQAAHSSPVGIPNYGKVTAISGLPELECSGSFAPSITIQNLGSSTLTSCTINYQVDNGTPMTTPWSGSLNTGATTNATLPAITGVSGGYHTLKTWINNLNGNGSTAQMLVKTGGFNVAPTTAATAPISESFTSTTFPPTNWGLQNDDDGITWKRVSAGNTSNSAKFDCYSYNSPGTEDAFVMQPVDLSAATTATLTFDVAHARYSTNESDGLRVEVSTNCGTSWTSVYNKSGSTLATATTTTSPFTPSNANQWRNESVDLSSYSGQSNLYVRFVGVTDYGNNIYVDNINVTTVAGVDEEDNMSFQFYPNPTTDVLTLNMNLNADNVTATITNTLGQVIRQINIGEVAGATTQVINVADLSAGAYMITLNHNGTAITKQFIKN